MDIAHDTARPDAAHTDTPRVNGVAIDAASIDAERAHHEDEADPRAAACRALAIRELLRQRAVALALLDAQAPLDDAALDALLECELQVPKATRADCEHYYRLHPARFRRNDIIHASHILFAVTRRAPLALVRRKAEETLDRLRVEPQAFDALARDVSNCPSAAVGGSLGQLLRGDSVPEFERALFDSADLGILPRLVNTRFGFHVVRIDRRIDGDAQPFEAVEADIAAFLELRVRHKAMQQYVAVLAGQARIEGVELGDANGPLIH
ncbi:PpiC-type peptidyl-prolyl cis-trans isomerase [Burkholderia sp. lig30]|jgi:peptidyl-prolyl cis-trans isomerase C|uniref:peptidylprolyl isomerase n=1 Tax=Burkholderia sp. lig30 TaxID=1192124 RepID=UPI000460F889|nr:peptidylprolyl isomerase [Burkholderia sp. lig30]KDB09630.1 PpiC-type peptidyl-prolyl cis-trans isomerase [Burkholderia sp. lig30]